MKILHITPSYLPATRYGGPIYSIHNLCANLVKLGHEVHVFTTNIDGKTDSQVPLGKPVEIDDVKIWYFQSPILRKIYYSPSMMNELRHQVDSFDILHTHSIYLWPTWAAARVAKRRHKNFMLSPRGMLVTDLIHRKSRWIKTAWLNMIEKRNIAAAAGLHVTSSEEASALEDFSYRFPVIYKIPNGVNKPESYFRDEVSKDVLDIVDGDPYVLSFGRINWEKGLDRLIRSWSNVPEYRLVIAGNDEEGYLPKLVNEAYLSGVYKRVHFLPRSISGVDKEALMQTANLLVLSSYSENFGNVVLESMIRGVPVVVTEEVGAKEIVLKAGGGIVVHSGHLGESINDLLLSSERRVAMGKHGKNWVTQNLTWDKVAVQMEQCYRDILDNTE